MRLAFAATAHKFQGQTVQKPMCLVVDLMTVREPAQAYVMLSRVQELDQVFIVEKLPVDKLKPSNVALRTLHRIAVFCSSGIVMTKTESELHF